MKYNFETLPERWKTDSVKWKYREMLEHYQPDNKLNFPPDDQLMPFWVADSDLGSPPFVLDAIKKRLDIPTLGYQLTPDRLKNAVVDWMQTRHGWTISPDDVVPVPGVVVAFNLAAQTVVQPGDGVLVQTPAYGPFLSAASNADIEQHEMELFRGADGTYHIDWDAFENAVKENTRIFMLCNPHNPTGRVFTKEELERMAEICLKHKVLICSDEIHSDLVFSGHQHIPIAALSEEISDSTITLIAPSKTFNLAGLKTSFAIITNPELRKKYNSSGMGLIGGVNALGMIAAETAYSAEGGEWLDQQLVHLEANRDLLVTYIRENIPALDIISPEGTFLAWIDCSRLNLDQKPYEYLIEEAGLVLNDGEWFGKGGDTFIRMNFACPRNYLRKGLEKLAEAVNKL